MVHPTLQRIGTMETYNTELCNAAALARHKVPLAIGSGFEDYVPKTRLLRYEASGSPSACIARSSQPAEQLFLAQPAFQAAAVPPAPVRRDAADHVGRRQRRRGRAQGIDCQRRP